jgi:hypothetical protein
MNFMKMASRRFEKQNTSWTKTGVAYFSPELLRRQGANVQALTLPIPTSRRSVSQLCLKAQAILKAN